MRFGYRMWTVPEAKEITRTHGTEDEKLKLISDGCGLKAVSICLSFIFSLPIEKMYQQQKNVKQGTNMLRQRELLEGLAMYIYPFVYLFIF